MLNGYFYFVLITVIGFYLLDLCGRLLNLRALTPELPGDFTDVFPSGQPSTSQQHDDKVKKKHV